MNRRKADGAKELKELEKRNARLKKLLAEAEAEAGLDRSMLKELAVESCYPESLPPNSGLARGAVRGLRTPCLSGGGPSTVHPTTRPTGPL